MAHYGMLRDYRFTDDVDDIRGAVVYAADGTKIGKVDDVIFDHEDGAIRYLVVHLGHRAKVLVPSDHVFRGVTDEESFQTDLSYDDAEHLPEFEESMLQDERQWRQHHDESGRVWREHEQKMQEKYEKEWHDAPVQHRHGSDRNITPEETSEPAAGPVGRREVTAGDLFPEPLADKFSGTGPMTVPSTNQSAPQTTLKPGAQSGAGSNLPLSPRWSGFQKRVRGNLGNIRERCPVCCQGRDARVA